MGRNGKSRALICFVLCMIMALPVYFSSAVAVKAADHHHRNECRVFTV